MFPTELLAAMIAICDEFEAYGWRRVRAALQHQGICANHKRIKPLMRAAIKNIERLVWHHQNLRSRF